MTAKISTPEMEEAIAGYFNYRQNIIVPNISWGFFIHECDLLIIRKTGYVLEVEIKISRADLIKDGEKKHNHEDYFNRIKELWFAIPDYLEDCIDLIPKNAGIITVYYNEWAEKLCCKIIRNAVINKNARSLAQNEILKVAKLGTMRIWGLKRKIINNKKPVKKRIVYDKSQLKLQYD